MESLIHNHGWQLLGWGLTAVALIFIWMSAGTAIKRFLGESWTELQKCAWPWDPQQKGFAKYKELVDSTVVVVVSSILLAAYVTSADFLLMKVVGFLTRFNF